MKTISLLGAALVAVFASCRHPTQQTLVSGNCRLLDEVKDRWTAEQGDVRTRNADLLRLKRLRRYVAVSRIRPFAHHFKVWFVHIEDNECSVRATSASDIEVEFCVWGGIVRRPTTRIEAPADLQPLAAAVLEHSRARCDGHAIDIAYLGQYREVDVHELVPDFILEKLDGSPRGSGKNWFVRLRTDASMTRITGVTFTGGAATALFDLPPNVRWVDMGSDDRSPFAFPRGQLTVDADAIEPVLGVARGTEDVAPGGRPLDRILERQGDALLPPGTDSMIDVTLGIRHASADRDMFELPVRFSLREALRTPVRATVERAEGGMTLRSTVTLSSDVPLEPKHSDQRVLLRLGVRIENERRQVVDRIYLVKAIVAFDGVSAHGELALDAQSFPFPATGPDRFDVQPYLSVAKR